MLELTSLYYDGRVLARKRVYNIGSQPAQVLGMRFYVSDRNNKVMGLDFNIDTVGHLYQEAQSNNLISRSIPLYLPEGTDTFQTEEEIEDKLKMIDCSYESQFFEYLLKLTQYKDTGRLATFLPLLLGRIGYKFRVSRDTTCILSNIWSNAYISGDIVESGGFDIEASGITQSIGIWVQKDGAVKISCDINRLPHLGSKKATIYLISSDLETREEAVYLADILIELAGAMLILYSGQLKGKKWVRAIDRMFDVQEDVSVSVVRRKGITEVISLER